MKHRYLQVLSMTDHTKPLQDRYEGLYSGLNEDLSTSEWVQDVLWISSQAKGLKGPLDPKELEKARVIIAYRHHDTGVLQGTSETLLCISVLPFKEIPGFEVISLAPDGGMLLKLWNQDLLLPPNEVLRVHFGKTVAFLKCFGETSLLRFKDTTLTEGPSRLHGQNIEKDLTLAPPSGSALSVKMGQDIENL